MVKFLVRIQARKLPIAWSECALPRDSKPLIEPLLWEEYFLTNNKLTDLDSSVATLSGKNKYWHACITVQKLDHLLLGILNIENIQHPDNTQ